MTTLPDDQIVACCRCGRPCRLAATRTEDARLLRNALPPADGGFCANCAMTAFIRHGDGLGLIFREEPDPGVFRARHVQEAVERLLVVGNADARAEDLDWEIIVGNWDLPFPGIPRPKKKRA